jgi:hypothetical protein
MAIPWATNLLHFHINKLFKFVNLALFCLLTVLATFLKNWVIFSKSSGHPVWHRQMLDIASVKKIKFKRLVVLQINSRGFIMDLNYLERMKLT